MSRWRGDLRIALSVQAVLFQDCAMSRRRARTTTPTRRRLSRQPLLISAALGGAVVVAGIIAWALLSTVPRPAPTSTGGCRGTPAFTANAAIVPAELGLAGQLALATDRPEKGLTLSALGTTLLPYRHPSWDDAGFLGGIAYDQAGTIYAAPTPRLSLVDNPLSGQAMIWRVESTSAEMRPFVTVPGAATERNPYGIMSLAYVCGLDRLYAGTVLGSTPTEERGGVVMINPATGAQTPILTGFDVLSVLIVETGQGYDLYAGLARRPEVMVVALDARGQVRETPRPLLDLTQAGASASERARKLQVADGRLLVDLVPFNYSLQSSASDVPQVRRVTWAWDARVWVAQQAAEAPEIGS